MAEQPPQPPHPPKSATVKLDGDHVLQALKAAGMDPHKIDVRKTLPNLHYDYEELESRLKGSLAPSKGGWHVAVVVSRD